MADYGDYAGRFDKTPPSKIANQELDHPVFSGASRLHIDRAKLELAIRDHVVRRVVMNHQHDGGAPHAAPAEPPSREGIYFKTLLGALLERDSTYFQAMLDQLEAEEAPLIAICQTLVMPISAELGQMWLDDRETFATISLASARLQMLVNHIAVSHSRNVPSDARRKILFARMPGDNHTLGLTVIAGCFTEEGWVVDGGADLEAGRATLDMIGAGDYAVFGISVGSTARLDDVAAIISKSDGLRRQKKFKIGVGGPAVGGRANAFLDIGADFAACDAREALSLAEEALR